MKIQKLFLFAILASLLGSAFAAKPKEVTLEDVQKSYLVREAAFTKELDAARAALPEGAIAKDLLPEKSELRKSSLFYLRYLTHLERTLRMAMIDDATRKSQLSSELLLAGEDRRIQKMWVELQAERFLQLAPPKEEKKSRRKKRATDSAEVNLNERFESRAKSFTRKREQNQKRLDMAYSKARLDDRLIENLEKEIEIIEAQLEEVYLAYFGQPIAEGFELSVDFAGDTPEEKLLLKVVSARDSLLRALRGKEPLKQEGKKKSATIGEMVIQSENLGVILDASGSMTKFLAPLKEEIAKEFRNPHYREILGCRLAWSLVPLGAKADGSMLAMEDLLIVQKTDAIFWFSDLKDAESPKAIARLKWLLETAKASFYVNSVGLKPRRALEPLITEFRKK